VRERQEVQSLLFAAREMEDLPVADPLALPRDASAAPLLEFHNDFEFGPGVHKDLESAVISPALSYSSVRSQPNPKGRNKEKYHFARTRVASWRLHPTAITRRKINNKKCAPLEEATVACAVVRQPLANGSETHGGTNYMTPKSSQSQFRNLSARDFPLVKYRPDAIPGRQGKVRLLSAAHARRVTAPVV
jgi:hypothetical protein